MKYHTHYREGMNKGEREDQGASLKGKMFPSLTLLIKGRSNNDELI